VMNNMFNYDPREMTENNLRRELNTFVDSYMKIYDEYYKTSSRDSAFLKDLADAVLGISAVLEVYARDGKIYPDYVLEKLSNSKSYIDYCIKYYESKMEKDTEE